MDRCKKHGGAIMKKLNELQKLMRKMACLTHGGKMAGLISISTSPYNPICDRRAANVNSVCHHCFSRRMMQIYKALAAKLAKNRDILSTVEFTAADVYHFKPKSGYFRFEAFGDLFSTLQVKNYFTIADVLAADGIQCALWTKNPQVIKAAFEEYGLVKPANLNIIYSVAGLNSNAAAAIYDAFKECGYDFIDKVFTVYDAEHAAGVTINCGARDCATCGRCYTKNDIVFINEKLK